jgi:hypothetical protein
MLQIVGAKTTKAILRVLKPNGKLRLPGGHSF